MCICIVSWFPGHMYSKKHSVSAQLSKEGNKHDDSLGNSIFENTKQTSVRTVVLPKFGQMLASHSV